MNMCGVIELISNIPLPYSSLGHSNIPIQLLLRQQIFEFN